MVSLLSPTRRYYRLTVDDPIDLVVVRNICAGIQPSNSILISTT